MTQEEALTVLKAGKNVFLTGGAGAGKTYVLNSYIEYLKDRKVPVVVTASTGIAATHLGGMTIHSWSGLGIRDSLSPGEIDDLTTKKYLAKRFEKVKVLILDEISMLDAGRFDALSRLLAAAKNNELPFGGIQIVISGDFYQLPPITRGNIEPEFAFMSDVWRDAELKICYLTTQYRQEDDPLSGILQDIRDGKDEEEVRLALSSRYCKEGEESESDDTTVMTKLYTHNVDVDRINAQHYKELKGKEKTYTVEGAGKKSTQQFLLGNILAPEVLKLKVGTKVMFVKNNFDKGFVNGTLGEVTGFEGSTPLVETNQGETIEVGPEEWSVEEDGKKFASITQLPLRYAWAITVHKSQGMTLDAALVDLSKTFTPGQGYVALSRVRSLKGLNIVGLNEHALRTSERVREVDTQFRRMSDGLCKVIAKVEDMETRHEEFVISCGGIIKKEEIEAEKKKSKNLLKKESTFEQTKEMIGKTMSLSSMVRDRGIKQGTIISHIERLLEEGRISQAEISYLRPRDDEFDGLIELIDDIKGEVGLERLSPLKEAAPTKYSFDDIRLARLFVL